jgi:acetyltransferase-like isoleucine patch superfamily enzyme
MNTLASFAISGGCYFQAINGIHLGKSFLFAPGVKLISANHDMTNNGKYIIGKPIIIGDNVWLGADVIILPEVEIGDNCIVGAGSVVTKSFKKKNLIIAGNPAIIIGKQLC